MPGAIYAEGLVKTFGDVTALGGVDLDVPQGTVLDFSAPTGPAKTTAVRVLTTLLRPDSGSAFVAGIDVLKKPNEVRRSIGLSGQFAAVDEYLTGRENLQMVGQLYQMSSRDAKVRAAELLERFNLADAADRTAKTYSGGMRRRLDLAAALVVSPPVMFMDEPTTGLDPRNRQQLWDVIEELVAAWHDAAAHHAVPGGGRPPRPRHLRDRPRPRHRPRHLRPAQGPHRRRTRRGRRPAARPDRPGPRGPRPPGQGRGRRRPAHAQADRSGRRRRQAPRRGHPRPGRPRRGDRRHQLRRPTLDDVFISLTGHAAEQEKGDENGADAATAARTEAEK